MAQDLRYTTIVNDDPEAKRLMLHGLGDGSALLYVFNSLFDGGCNGDHYFTTIQDAIDSINEDYGRGALQWFAVERPFPHCQDDWITPARIPGRDTGDPQWGRLQLYTDGQWREVDMTQPSRVTIDYNALQRVDLPDRTAG